MTRREYRKWRETELAKTKAVTEQGRTAFGELKAAMGEISMMTQAMMMRPLKINRGGGQPPQSPARPH